MMTLSLLPCYVLTPYVDFESSQLFHLDGLQMFLNISIACWYFSLVDNPTNTSFLLLNIYLNTINLFTSCLSSLQVRSAFAFEFSGFIYINLSCDFM